MPTPHLAGIALQQLVSGAVSLARFSNPAVAVAADAAQGVVARAMDILQSRFTDQSARLTAAIESATDRAWRALELVLAGDSIWDRLKGALTAADVKAFRHDVRGLLAAAGVDGSFPVDRRAAVNELRAARKAKVLQPTGLTPAGMIGSVGVFARFDNPAELAAAQWQATDAVAADLKALGYPTLAAVAAFRPPEATLPLLGVAVRYFFRRAVERDAELARGLAFARLEALSETQQNQFDALDHLLTERADRLDAAIGELAVEVGEVKVIALDIRAEQERLGDQNRQIMEAVVALQGKLQQVGRASVRPQDSLSVRSDAERDLVRKVIAQYRGLPESDRQGRPALRNAVGMLEVAAGDFAAARTDFAAVAEQVADPTARGEAQRNAYRAALEARDWAGALRELVAAARIDARRFAPFPVGKYVPQRILGAGGFGVAFLCKHKYMDAPVVVKALSGGGERDFEAVFAEARAAAAIQHPGIVRITDCGYVDSATKDRPFVVMDYFPGKALDDHVREHGPLAADDLVPLARDLAEALAAAHQKGILHRDVKPGNVLVRPAGDGLEARVIDFGLAVWHRQAVAETPHTRAAKTLLGETIAGTVEYAAPEQMGRSAVRPGPYSDVYGWAKTCCFALFQTAQPTLRHWQGIPTGLADLLGRCLEEVPGHRPQSFVEVIAELDRLAAAPPVVEARVVAVPAERPRPRPEPEDDRPAREPRRERDERPFRPRRRKAGGFPVWAAVSIPLGVVLVAVVVLAVVLANRKKPTDGPDQANNPAPADTTGGGKTPVRPGGGGGGKVIPGVPQPGPGGQVTTPPKKEWTWPGGPPSPRPYLPVGWMETKALGGFIGNVEFRDTRQDGSVIVGFEVGLGKVFNTDIITYLRPVWLTHAGEQMGTAYGRKPANGFWLDKAKDGYALGGVVVAGGGHLEGICFTYLRINGNALDPDDWYTSTWYGEQTRKPNANDMRAGDGSPVVGFYGTRFPDKGGNKPDDSGSVCTIGLVIAPPGK